MPVPAPLEARRPAPHLYVHVPFCAAPCDYCGFYKEAGTGNERRRQYLDHLADEARQRAAHAGPLASIYIGGGTPSLLDVAEWQRLVELLDASFVRRPDAEWSLEANPDTVTAEKVAAWRAAGVNRVTLGVQSFAPAKRRAMGRRGNVERIIPAVEALRHGGIDNLGVDLIYGAPHESLADWEADLRGAIELAPDHLSAYGLSLESDAPWAANPPQLADDDLAVDMWQLAEELLGEAGLCWYEISNFARPGYRCRHNLGVWYGDPLVGLGPSAGWFDGVVRYHNTPDLDRWLNGEPPLEDPLPPMHRAMEILISGLRVVDGWDADHFLAATGYSFDQAGGAMLAEFCECGLLERDEANLRLSPEGRLFLDHVAREL